LIGIGKHDEARQIIATMNNTSLDDPVVIDAIEELEIGIRAENEGGKVSWMECFSTRNMLWKRTMNGMVLQCIQQLNGQNFCIPSLSFDSA
jgi:MFS transporter, SP family, sugar:H+ symporter